MADKNYSSLLPIKKAVTDPGKGLILRTYYIRPEKLKKVLEELKENALIYVKNSKLDEIAERIQKTGDISDLRSHINNDKVFRELLIHTYEVPRVLALEPSNYLNVVTHKINSFILTNNEQYLKKLSSDIKKAAMRYNLNYKINTKKLKKPKISKSKRIREQTEKVPFQVGDYLTEETPYLQKDYDPIGTAAKLSKILNFFHPSEFKLMKIFKTLLGTDFKDNTYIIHNILLVPDLYYKNQFVIDLLKSIIASKYKVIYGLADEEDFKYVNTEWLPYFYLLLPEEERKNILHTYPDKFIEHILTLDSWKDILKEVNSDELIYSYLLTTDKVWIQKNLYSILNDSPPEKVLSYVKYLALRKDIPSNIVLSLFQTHIKQPFYDISRGISNIVNNHVKGFPVSYEGLLTQILLSTLTNQKYIPYDKITSIKDIFTPYLVTKFGKDILDRYSDKLIEWLKIRQPSSNQKITLYYNLPNSSYYEYYYHLGVQLPIRVEPLMALTTEPKTEINIPLTINLDKTIQYNDDIYLVLGSDLINNVSEGY